MGKFLELVANIMEVNVEDISMETEYKVFERWDSLMMLTLTMELEAEYGKTIPVESLGNIKTLADMFDLVK